jgi:hypothetical protein
VLVSVLLQALELGLELVLQLEVEFLMVVV